MRLYYFIVNVNLRVCYLCLLIYPYANMFKWQEKFKKSRLLLLLLVCCCWGNVCINIMWKSWSTYHTEPYTYRRTCYSILEIMTILSFFFVRTCTYIQERAWRKIEYLRAVSWRRKKRHMWYGKFVKTRR